MQLDVVTVGEAMVQFAALQPGPLDAAEVFTRTTAGAELNVAIGLARLGLRVGYVSALGNDPFGRCCRARSTGKAWTAPMSPSTWSTPPGSC